MTLRRLAQRLPLPRRTPPPPPPAPTGPLALLWQQFERLVGASAVPAQIFYENLLALRPWWPVLLPVLIWYLRHRYRIERAALVERSELSAGVKREA